MKKVQISKSILFEIILANFILAKYLSGLQVLDWREEEIK